MERLELAVGLEVGLDDNEPANVRGDQRGRKLRESLVLRKRRREWNSGMCHAGISGGAVLEAPARVRAEPGEVEVDGVDGATGEDAVVADGAAAAAVGEDGHAVGAARIVGVHVRGGRFRAEGVVVAGGATDDRHAGERSRAVAAGGAIPIAVTHAGVSSMTCSAACAIAQARTMARTRTGDI